MDLGKKVSKRPLIFYNVALILDNFFLTEENHEPRFAIVYKQLKKVKFYENGLAHFCQFAKSKR